MGRRVQHRHYDTGKTIKEGDRDQKVALCNKQYWRSDFAKDNDKSRVDCPECAKMLSRQDLDAYHAVATNPKLELLPIPKDENRGYRFAYRAVIGGKHVGYIVYDGAYASGAWYVTEIRIDDKKNTFGTGAHLAKDDGASSRYDHKGLEYITKDRALLAIPELVAAKRLQTVAETKQARAEWAARLARGEAIHQARQAEEDQKRKEALEAWIEIRDSLNLSNFQRSGVEYAILRLTPKKKPEDEAEES